MLVRVSWIVVFAVVAAACSGASDGSPSTTTAQANGQTEPTEATSAAPETATTTTIAPRNPAIVEDGPEVVDEVAAHLNDGAYPLDVALDLFSSVHGEIPGGDPSRFTDLEHGEGTAAIRAILSHWDELDAVQQSAVRAQLGIGQVDAAGEVNAVLASYQDADAILAEAQRASAEIAGHVGRELSFPITVEMVPDSTWSDNTVADTMSMRDGDLALDGRPDECHMRYGQGNGMDRRLIAHEVFHCYQYDYGGDLRGHWVTPDWIAEGSAEWAAAQVAGVDDTVFYHFESWLRNGFSLFNLRYFAVGFFYVMETMGADPWTVSLQMQGKSNGDAIAETGLDPVELARLMATSQPHRTMSGIDVSSKWNFGPGDTPAAYLLVPRRVSPDAAFGFTRPRGSFGRSPSFNIHFIDGDIVDVTASSPVGALEFYGQEDFIQWNGSFTQSFCIKPEGCDCGVDETLAALEQGSEDMVFSLGTVEASDVSIDVSVRSLSDGGFGEGAWQGQLTSTTVTTDADGTITRGDPLSAPFELVVSGGKVEGSYVVSMAMEWESPLGDTATGTAVRGGVIGGCAFAPTMTPIEFKFEGTMTMDGEALPFNLAIPFEPAVTAPTWVFNETSDDSVSGELETGPFLELMRASGVSVNEVEIRFEAGRTS